jgi:Spy/CpxP family protein refolding chaperone
MSGCISAQNRKRFWRTTGRDTGTRLASCAKLDMAQINQFHTTLKDLHGRRADHRLEGILEVRKILTPEQFSEFMELMERHRPWKGKGHGGPERRFK